MTDYTIAETFLLPSEGKIYSKKIDPNVKLRSMTTAHEMQRCSPSDLPYKNMCDILDDCIVNDLGMSAYDLCLGDYLFLLHRLRVVTYGSTYRIQTQCQYCGSITEKELNLEELPVLNYNEEIEKLKEFELPITKKTVTLKFQTPRMLDEITEKSREFKNKADIKFDPTMLFTLEAMIDKVDGKKPNPITFQDWLRELPMADTNTILAYSEKLNNAIGVKLTLDITCRVCGLEYPSAFKVNSEFFRPALNIGR